MTGMATLAESERLLSWRAERHARQMWLCSTALPPSISCADAKVYCPSPWEAGEPGTLHLALPTGKWRQVWNHGVMVAYARKHAASTKPDILRAPSERTPSIRALPKGQIPRRRGKVKVRGCEETSTAAGMLLFRTGGTGRERAVRPPVKQPGSRVSSSCATG